MAESAERARAPDEREKGDGERTAAPPPADMSPSGTRHPGVVDDTRDPGHVEGEPGRDPPPLHPESLHPDDPPPPPRKPNPRPRLQRVLSYLAALFRGVWRKGEEDEIFFLAGAISFNVLVAFIPLLITVVGVAGIALRRLGADAEQQLLDYVGQIIPEAVDLNLAGLIDILAAESAGILSVGALFFLWVATRLVGTLRVVLRDIFDIPEGRSIVAGKIFDIKMLIAAGTLFALNVALTLGLTFSARFVATELHIDPADVPFIGQATQLWPQLLAFVTIWFMFFLIYRYLPPRRIKVSTAMIAATFTATLGEALKYGFSWYVTEVARYSAWGGIATFVIVVVWLYYTAVVFVLGGEVAQVISMQRTRKRQKQRLA